MENLRDRLVAIPRFALLNEPRVLYGPRGIENELDALIARVLSNPAQVGKADRLSARQIHRRRNANVWHPFDAHGLDKSVEPRDVDVALERVFGLGVVRR